MRDAERLHIARFASAPVMAAVMIEVRTVPVMMAAHMVMAVPVMVAAHMMMAIMSVVVTAILHFGRQAFTGALHRRCDAGIVERDRVRLRRRRGHEHQACDGGEAEQFLHVHECSPEFRTHSKMHAALGSSPMHRR